jgi:hypothetical protein
VAVSELKSIAEQVSCSFFVQNISSIACPCLGTDLDRVRKKTLVNTVILTQIIPMIALCGSIWTDNSNNRVSRTTDKDRHHWSHHRSTHRYGDPRQLYNALNSIPAPRQQRKPQPQSPQ